MSRSDTWSGNGQDFSRNGEKHQTPDFKKIYKHRSE